ncbi:uncharacterized protein BDZ99DRAFT_560049 [Mytilinidion resinicola]|uniref:Uncharacterized protein n=1 Tax=Mytilinidion resinicola TaxID=574789 RepID=A0A6A6YT29_9PEZI|nr:uncharacterized protein BDZ99DRAFT_560049 [Mytilinidion resinicola]KAF2811718.1 hypothetical protein BDZ99DRAFT_560049 [Mytilinidion resinicola]
MKILDQLLGSTSIFATVVTQLKYRNIGLLGALLLLLWSLSPIGGQASLRVLDFGTSTSTYPQTIQFLDRNSSFNPRDYGDHRLEADGQTSIATMDALYVSALLSPLTTRTSPVDTWGNVKIPMLEHLSNLTKDAEGWQQVGTEDQTVFSSLIGVPQTAVPLDHQTTFSMETSYFALDCPVLVKDDDPREPRMSKIGAFQNGSVIPKSDWVGTLGYSWTLATPSFMYNSRANSSQLSQAYGNGTNMAPRKLYYSSADDGVDDKGNRINTYAECTMNTSYVEVRVSCDGKKCAATHMRPSTQPPVASAWTVADAGRERFFTDFATAVGGNSYEPTAVQRYIWGTVNPFNATKSGLALYKKDPKVFAIGFA